MASQSPDDVAALHLTGDQEALTAWLDDHGWAIVMGVWVNDAVFLDRIGDGPDDHITAIPGQVLAAVGLTRPAHRSPVTGMLPPTAERGREKECLGWGR